MRGGPTLPYIEGWHYLWVNESAWPIEEINGVYKTPILFFGTCNDDAVLTEPGVVAVYSEQEFAALRFTEYMARKPFPSWVGDEATMTWQAPIPMPVDENTTFANYYWDEASLSWISYGTPVRLMP